MAKCLRIYSQFRRVASWKDGINKYNGNSQNEYRICGEKSTLKQKEHNQTRFC